MSRPHVVKRFHYLTALTIATTALAPAKITTTTTKRFQQFSDAK
jgi:hypothetical protein